MARGKAKAGKSRKSGQTRSRPSLSLTKALGLIILIEGVALGLKAYDDRQRMLDAKQIETHREALALSERMGGTSLHRHADPADWVSGGVDARAS